ncbi:MAG: hypothetical protein AABX23_02345 [Nanoarchaeota archaeon]
MLFKKFKNVLSLILLFPLVSAQTSETIPFFSDLGNWFTNTLSFLFSTREIATKFLFSILLFMVLYTTVDVVFKRKWYFTIGMTAIVTVLSVVLTPDDLLSAVLTNYGALGSAILTIIPLLIILIFTVRIQSALVGRVLWMFYALYYFGFLLYMTLSGSEPFFSASHIPYFGAIIGGIFMFFFIPAIREAIFKGELSQIKQEGRIVASRAKLLHKLQKEELKAYDVEEDNKK